MNLLFFSHDKTLVADTIASDTAERQIAYANILNAKRPGSHIHIFVRADAVGDATKQLSPHVMVYAVGQPLHKFIRNSTNLARQLAKSSPIHLVSSQSPFSDGILALWLSGRFQAKLLVQLHMSSLSNVTWLAESTTNRLRAKVARKVMTSAAAVRVTNPTIKQWLVTHWEIPSHRICVNAVGHLVLKSDPNVSRSKQPSLLYVGRLSAEKGVDVLLKSFAAIQNDLPTATLTLVGDGPQKDALVHLTNQLNIQDHVTFTSSLSPDDLPAYYQRAWLLVLPSHHESYGRVILEAFSMQLPVLATATEGAQLLVQQGKTGYLVPIANQEALSTQLTTALKQPAILAKMGQSAYAYVQKEHSVEKMRHAFVNMWINIVETNSVNPSEVPE